MLAEIWKKAIKRVDIDILVSKKFYHTIYYLGDAHYKCIRIGFFNASIWHIPKYPKSNL